MITVRRNDKIWKMNWNEWKSMKVNENDAQWCTMMEAEGDWKWAKWAPPVVPSVRFGGLPSAAAVSPDARPGSIEHSKIGHFWRTRNEQGLSLFCLFHAFSTSSDKFSETHIWSTPSFSQNVTDGSYFSHLFTSFHIFSHYPTSSRTLSRIQIHPVGPTGT